MIVTSGIGIANGVLEGPRSAMGWVAEAIWAIVFLAIVGSLIFFLTSVLRAIGQLKLKALLVCAAVISALLAFLMGYRPPFSVL